MEDQQPEDFQYVPGIDPTGTRVGLIGGTTFADLMFAAFERDPFPKFGSASEPEIQKFSLQISDGVLSWFSPHFHGTRIILGLLGPGVATILITEASAGTLRISKGPREVVFLLGV